MVNGTIGECLYLGNHQCPRSPAGGSDDTNADMTAFADIEAQKTAMLARIEAWPAERLTYRPAPEEWSAIEVLDHLVNVETGVLAAMRRGLEAPNRIGVRDRLGFLLVDLVFRSRRRVKVPMSAKRVLPGDEADMTDLVPRWDASRVALGELLAHLSPEDTRQGVFRHPVSGWMNVPQVLRFFSTHITHHHFQLDRLDAAWEASAHPRISRGSG